MMNVCYNKDDKDYKNYGAKGITICNKWLIFKGFKEDHQDADLNKRFSRIDKNKGYYPENCKWETSETNSAIYKKILRAKKALKSAEENVAINQEIKEVAGQYKLTRNTTTSFPVFEPGHRNWKANRYKIVLPRQI